MSIPETLFRNASSEILGRFISEGEIRFRPLIYYRNIEDSSRRDEFEGALTTKLVGAKIEIFDEATKKYIAPLEIQSGRMNFTLDKLDDLHVSCYSVDRQTAFGESTVEIFDVDGFLSHLDNGFKLVGINLQWGKVRYYDENVPGQKPDAGYMWLYKRLNFSSENEFRISFLLDRRKFFARCFPDKYGKPESLVPDFIPLRFGNLSKFARVSPQ